MTVASHFMVVTPCLQTSKVSPFCQGAIWHPPTHTPTHWHSEICAACIHWQISILMRATFRKQQINTSGLKTWRWHSGTLSRTRHVALSCH